MSEELRVETIRKTVNAEDYVEETEATRKEEIVVFANDTTSSPIATTSKPAATTSEKQAEGIATTATTTTVSAKKDTPKTVEVPIGRASEKPADTIATVDDFVAEDEAKTGSKKTTSRRNVSHARMMYTRAELEKAKKSIEIQSKELGIDFASLSRDEKVMYLGLTVAQQRGEITREELLKLVDEFISDEVSEDVKAEITEGTEHIDEAKLNRIRGIIKRHANMRSAMTFVAVNNIHEIDKAKRQQMQEEFLEKAARSAETTHKKMLEKVAKTLPENCTESVARTVLDATKDFVSEYSSNLLTFVNKNGFSTNFISTLANITSNVIKKAVEVAANFVEKFFDTVKGKAIREYTKRIIQKVVNKKQECKELEIKTAENKAAVAVQTKKFEEIQYRTLQLERQAEKNVHELAMRRGLGTLSYEKRDKFLKENCPADYNKLVAARTNKEKTYWALYDAESAKRLSESFLAIAQRSLAQMKTMAMLSIARMMNY